MRISASESRAIVRLSDTPEEWIVRRTERIRFEDDGSIERRTTFELDISDKLRNTVPLIRGGRATPIIDLVRSPSLHVRVMQNGHRVPVLLRGEEREIVTDYITGLVANADLSAVNPAVSPQASRASLRGYVRYRLDPVMMAHQEPRDPEADKLSEAALERADAADAMDWCSDLRILVALCDWEQWPVQVDAVHTEAIDVVRAGPALAAQVWRRRNDSRHSTFAVWLKAGKPSLVVADGSALRVATATDEAQGKRLHLKHWRWPWWIPDTCYSTLTCDQFLNCKSYHLNVEVPEGVYIDSANLRALNEADEDADDVPHDSEMIIVYDDDHHADSAHLHFSRGLSRRQSPDDEYYPPALRVVLRPTYYGGTRSGFMISAFSLTVLWLVTLTVGWRAADFRPRGVGIRFGAADVNSLVSLLLLAPTAIIASIVRQREHGLTKRVQFRYRSRLALTGAALFSSAMLVALGLDGEGLFWSLLGAATLTTILGFLTAVSAQYSRLRVRTKGRL